MEIAQFDREIKSNNFKNVYLLYGAEKYMIEERLKLFRRKVLDGQFDDFNYHVFEADRGIDYTEVSDAVESFPVMSEKKLVIIKNSNAFSTAKGEMLKFFEDLIENIPESTVLVFSENEIDGKKKKVLSQIAEKGGIVEFAPLNARQIALWIEKQLDKCGKQMITRDLDYMVSICGTSLKNAQNELSKLLNFAKDKNKISREDIDAVVTKTVEFKVFDMLDDIIENRRQKVFETIKEIQDTREQPTVILAILMGKIADLLMVKQLYEQGLRLDEIKKYFDYNKQFLAQKSLNQSKNFSEKYLRRILTKGLQYDVDIKTGKLSGWIAVIMYVTELTL